MNTIIQTPTPVLDKSLNFYRRLGFNQLDHPEYHFVSDGQCLIQINPDRYARAGLRLFEDSWAKARSALKNSTAITPTEEGYLLSGPSGIIVYLVEGESGPDIDIKKFDLSLLGNFAGLSLETADILRSVQFWEILGFIKTMGDPEKGWVALQNEDKMTVSLMRPNMCPHLFFNPSLTYFNGKNNLLVIENVRNAGIPITEEITHFNQEDIVDNIIIRDPGGYGFFIFND